LADWVFCMIVFIVCLAFIDYLESALEKALHTDSDGVP